MTFVPPCIYICKQHIQHNVCIEAYSAQYVSLSVNIQSTPLTTLLSTLLDKCRHTASMHSLVHTQLVSYYGQLCMLGFRFYFKLIRIWYCWQFFFKIQIKRNFVWFYIERKTVTTDENIIFQLERSYISFFFPCTHTQLTIITN